MRKRWFRILGLAVLIPFLLLAVFLVCERVRGQVSLARYKRALAAKGVKLTARELASPLPAGENGAPAFLEAANRLKRGAVLPEQYPPRMRATQAGRAIVCFRESQWVENKVTNRWEQVALDLQTNAATLGEICAALNKPVLNNQLDLSLGAKLPFTNLWPVKSVARWFGPASQLALHEGKTHEAMTNLIPEIQLPRVLAEDRIVISELVRIAVAAIARADTWEALQADGWTDDDLVQVQHAWENQHFAAAMAHSMEGELVFGLAASESLRKSNKETIGMLYAMENFFASEDENQPWWDAAIRTAEKLFKEQVYCRVWRFAWLDQDERHCLEQQHRLLKIARDAAANKSFAETKTALDRLEANSLHRNFYDKLRYPEPFSPFSLLRAMNTGLRAETERSMTICAIALKRYALRHGRLPASLESLAPEFIDSVPIDYMDGKPTKYHLNSDGTFTLYSVGENCRDDGGDTSLLPGKTGIGNAWNRKDFVWPAPALPEEIEAYRKGKDRKN